MYLTERVTVNRLSLITKRQGVIEIFREV